MIRRWRIVSQTAFFLLFLFLLMRTQYSGSDSLRTPVKTLLEIDPLHLLTTLLATGAVAGLMWLALITLALTFVFGRFFCGWVCPLGVLVQLAQKLPVRRRADVVASNRWHPSQKIKFYLLAALLAAAVFGLQWSGLLDPLSIYVRSLGLVVLPGIELAARQLFEAVYRHDPLGLSAVTEPVFEWLQGRAFAFHQPRFLQAFPLGLLFIAILVLGFARHRFWCRTLCPLGALLGLVARTGLLRIRKSGECRGCARCTFECQGAAEPEASSGWRPSECLVCGNCTAVCAQSGLAMGFGRPSLPRLRPARRQGRVPKRVEGKRVEGERAQGQRGEGERAAGRRMPPRVARDGRAGEPSGPVGSQLERRHFLLAAVAGVVTVPLLRLTDGAGGRVHPALIRPPGALEESEFLARCVRCGECMKVCLTNGLQPTFLEAGFEGLWTPRLVPRTGYCEYQCTLCGQVCPTQAIRRLPIEEKRRVRIGLAQIDPGRCLPYAFQKNCIVCEEHCPLPVKAIWFEEVAVRDHRGESRVVKQPRVDLDLCTGCGICETKCVVRDLPAIRVTSANEDRNPGNRVLLDALRTPGRNPGS